MSNPKDVVEWAKLIWSEYEFRHELYWKSIYLWGGGAVAMFVAPFLRQEVQDLGSAVYIFPVLGLAISWIGTWHLAAESERMRAVMKKYNDLRKGFKPDWPYKDEERTWLQQAVTESVGSAVTLIFFIGLTAFAFVDVLFLFILSNRENWIAPFFGAAGIVVLVGAYFFLRVNGKKRRHNKKIAEGDSTQTAS
jgi:hypothetical protein